MTHASNTSFQVVDYQAYMTRFIHNYSLFREGINASNPTLSRSTTYRKATAVAVYIASNEFNIPLEVIADAIHISYESVVRALQNAEAYAQTYNWYSKKIQSFTTNIHRLLPPTAGILYKSFPPA